MVIVGVVQITTILVVEQTTGGGMIGTEINLHPLHHPHLLENRVAVEKEERESGGEGVTAGAIVAPIRLQ